MASTTESSLNGFGLIFGGGSKLYYDFQFNPEKKMSVLVPVLVSLPIAVAPTRLEYFVKEHQK
jgi:hypothetical protein